MSFARKHTDLRIADGPETVKRQYTVAPTRVTISGTTATSAILAVGDHYVTATCDCFLKQGASTITAATTDTPLYAGQEVVVHVDDATLRGYLAAITGGAAGTLHIKKVEAW